MTFGDFKDMVRDKTMKQISALQEACGGGVENGNEYWKKVGQIAGLKLSLRHMEEVLDDLNKEDEQ